MTGEARRRTGVGRCGRRGGVVRGRARETGVGPARGRPRPSVAAGCVRGAWIDVREAAGQHGREQAARQIGTIRGRGRAGTIADELVFERPRRHPGRSARAGPAGEPPVPAPGRATIGLCRFVRHDPKLRAGSSLPLDI